MWFWAMALGASSYSHGLAAAYCYDHHYKHYADFFSGTSKFQCAFSVMAVLLSALFALPGDDDK